MATKGSLSPDRTGRTTTILGVVARTVTAAGSRTDSTAVLALALALVPEQALELAFLAELQPPELLELVQEPAQVLAERLHLSRARHRADPRPDHRVVEAMRRAM